MAGASSFIGRRISLISKAEIRYVIAARVAADAHTLYLYPFFFSRL